MSSKSQQKTFFVVKYSTLYSIVYADVYAVEQFVLQETFPQFIIQSCFKSRSDYNGARTIVSVNIIPRNMVRT
jgi:hypothetical protein